MEKIARKENVSHLCISSLFNGIGQRIRGKMTTKVCDSHINVGCIEICTSRVECPIDFIQEGEKANGDFYFDYFNHINCLLFDNLEHEKGGTKCFGLLSQWEQIANTQGVLWHAVDQLSNNATDKAHQMVPNCYLLYRSFTSQHPNQLWTFFSVLPEPNS